jgi:hypothetical protein
MTGRRDEVEKGMDAVIPESRVTFDTRFLSQDIIILALEVSDDFLETGGM